MIVALEPEREVNNAEHLESLAEARRAVSRHSLEHLRDILAADLQRLLTVSVGERDYIVNGALSVLVRALPQREETIRYRLFVIRREVRDIAKLVDEVLRAYLLPLILSEAVRDILHRADKADLLVRENVRLLCLREPLKAIRHPLDRAHLCLAVYLRERFRVFLAESVMLLRENIFKQFL